MKGKAALAIGLAGGYVFGTKDGRQRYEQMKSQATRWWSDPRVQEKAAQARQLAQQTASKAQETTKAKASKVRAAKSSTGHEGGGTDVSSPGLPSDTAPSTSPSTPPSSPATSTGRTA